MAASLIRKLATKNRRFIGLGGRNCQRAGLKSAFDYRDLHLMGFWGVLWRLPLVYRRMRQLLALAEESRPAAVITVDSPDFSLRFAKRLRKRLPATPFIHLVAPSVWAWRQSRAAEMAKTYDHLLCLLPFEPRLFEKHGLKATFIGHPILEGVAIKPKSKPKSRLNLKSNVRIAVLPGSRPKEIATHFLFMGRVLRRLAGEYRLLKPLVVMAPDIAFTPEQKSAFAKMSGGAEYVSWENRRLAFKRADAAIATSGSISLELAAAATPSLIIYRLAYPLELLLRRLLKVRFASIINILAGRMLMPELIGGECREKAAAKALEKLLTRGAPQGEIARTLESLRSPSGISAAAIVESYL